MTERAWTLGPYAVSEPDYIGCRELRAGDTVIGFIIFGAEDNQESAATAHLIAAAPDLYEALAPLAAYAKDRQADDPGWHDENTVSIVVSIGELRAAKAALARAEGKS